MENCVLFELHSCTSCIWACSVKLLLLGMYRKMPRKVSSIGQNIEGQGRAGQGRAGQGRAGQGRAGQGTAGQGNMGQGRTGQG